MFELYCTAIKRVITLDKEERKRETQMEEREKNI